MAAHSDIVIRRGRPEDAAAICDIYNHYVLNTTVTFETEAVPVMDMQGRIGEVLGAGLPCFVAESGSRVAGFCYLHPWNTRKAYDATREVSIYVAHGTTGQGIGKRLLGQLLEATDRRSVHVLIAGICLPNPESVGLHESFGFSRASLMKQVGRKFGRWLDVGHWELILDDR